jgi:hypothetical protein
MEYEHEMGEDMSPDRNGGDDDMNDGSIHH